jgi:hypothetical protein
MAPETDVVRQQIDETRKALQAKLKALEDHVRTTVSSVAERVQHTRAAVEQTAASVRRTFDLGYQMNERPWALLGGCFVAGAVAGYVLADRRPVLSRSSPISRGGIAYRDREEKESTASVEALASSSGVSLLTRLAEPFAPELAKVKGLAVGVLMGAIRDILKDSIPANLAPHLEEILNNVTTKLGGTLMPEPVLPSLHPHDSSSHSSTAGSRQHQHAGSAY